MSGRLVSKQWVLDILRYADVEPDIRQQLLDLKYPVDLDTVSAVLSRSGLTKDWLMSRMGGSP